MPLKVKNFVWLVYQGRIQTADNLIRKQWKGDRKCKFCEEESVNHLLFLCPIASHLWCIIRDNLQWERTPRSVKGFNDSFLLERGHKGNGVLFLLFGAVCWSLWLNRNDWTLRNRLISSPRSVIYKFLFFMQRWTSLSTGED
jgi:hypothetical protein